MKRIVFLLLIAVVVAYVRVPEYPTDKGAEKNVQVSQPSDFQTSATIPVKGGSMSVGGTMKMKPVNGYKYPY